MFIAFGGIYILWMCGVATRATVKFTCKGAVEATTGDVARRNAAEGVYLVLCTPSPAAFLIP